MPDIGNIQPHTEFLVCAGLPITPDYTDTLTFKSKDAQIAFYRKYAKFELSSQTYQRVTSNKCRLELNAESVFECNYLCFCNKGYDLQAPYSTQRRVQVGTDPETGQPIYTYHYPESWDTYGGISTPTQNKWWYAFITDITYISNACVEITYQIDVMQTYMFDYTLPQTYIERMHIDVAADTIYTTRTDEDFDLGPLYVRQLDTWYFNENATEDNKHKAHRTEYKYLFLGGLSNPDNDSGKPDGDIDIIGKFVGRYPVALSKVELYDTFFDVTTAIKEYAKNGKINNIVAIYAVPAIFNQTDIAETPARQENFTAAIDGTPEVLGTFFQYEDNNIAWYTAINQKLQQYPFNRIVMTNFADKEVTLRHELFSTRTVPNSGGYKFQAFCTLLPTPCITVCPLDYAEENATLGGDYLRGFDPKHCITLDNYPQVAFGGSAYAAWWAQNITSGALPLKAVGSGLAAGMSAVVGALTAAGATAASGGTLAPVALGTAIGGITAGNTLIQGGAEAKKARYTSDPINSASQNSAANLNMDLNAVGFYHMAIGKAAAERIDNYFSRYGYAIHYNATPLGYRQDITSPGNMPRRRWNYLQLPNVVLSATNPINATHQQIIKQVYARGITFWHMNANNNLSIVGDYSRDAQVDNHNSL